MFSVVLYRCHGSRRFSVVLVDSQWFSVVFPVGSRRFSMVFVGSRWFLVVLVTYQWFSVVLTGYRRLSVVLVGCQCSLVLAGFQWFS